LNISVKRHQNLVLSFSHKTQRTAQNLAGISWLQLLYSEWPDGGPTVSRQCPPPAGMAIWWFYTAWLVVVWAATAVVDMEDRRPYST